MMFLQKGEENYLNLNKERNAENTNNYDYNCGGYAMGTLTWIRIETFSDRDSVDYNENENEEINKMLDNCIDELIDYFDGLARSINDVSELKEGEFAVLFRVAYDEEFGEFDDFHFLKRHHDGHYSHKPGSSPVKEFNENPFLCEWERPFVNYNSKIMVLAVSDLLY